MYTLISFPIEAGVDFAKEGKLDWQCQVIGRRVVMKNR